MENSDSPRECVFKSQIIWFWVGLKIVLTQNMTWLFSVGESGVAKTPSSLFRKMKTMELLPQHRLLAWFQPHVPPPTRHLKCGACARVFYMLHTRHAFSRATEANEKNNANSKKWDMVPTTSIQTSSSSSFIQCGFRSHRKKKVNRWYAVTPKEISPYLHRRVECQQKAMPLKRGFKDSYQKRDTEIFMLAYKKNTAAVAGDGLDAAMLSVCLRKYLLHAKGGKLTLLSEALRSVAVTTADG